MLQTRSRPLTAPVRSLVAILAAGILILSGCSNSDAPAPAPAPSGDANVDGPSEPSNPGSEDPQDNDSDAPGDDGGDSPDQASGSKGTVTWAHPGESFTFEIAFCAQYPEDILVHGPGKADSTGEVAYLDIDLYLDEDGGEFAGEARIDIGASRNMESTDDTRALRLGPDHGSTVDQSADRVTIQGPVWGNSGEDKGAGTIVVECR